MSLPWPCVGLWEMVMIGTLMMSSLVSWPQCLLDTEKKSASFNDAELRMMKAKLEIVERNGHVWHHSILNGSGCLMDGP